MNCHNPASKLPTARPGLLFDSFHLLRKDELVTVADTEVELFVNSNMEQLKQCDVEWVAMKEELDKKEADFQALKARVEEDAV